jgi:hypothetical protein
MRPSPIGGICLNAIQRHTFHDDATSAGFDLQEALQVIDSTIFELTRDAWVVWACFMGLWTTVQVLFSLARPRQ